MGEFSDWGPLAGLIGEWQGEGGLDSAFSHAREEVLATPYLEKVTMKPFGPVDNGSQHLYGLDYRTAMWRGDEENPFHTEVGYCLWDGEAKQVMRGFVVPRGITVLAGGTAEPDATTFTMSAKLGDPNYGVSENLYLSGAASTVHYEVTIRVNGPDEWSYAEDTTLIMREFSDPFPHTDHNTLRRTA
ncbi:MAG: heme-binding beta-barrel domain-containing protein [Acidimicrobiales bacterium]